MELIHAKNELGIGGGPTYVISRLIDCLIDLIAMNDGFYYAL